MPATLLETAANTLATAGTSITVTTTGAPSAGETLIAVVYHTDDFPATPAGWSKDREDPGQGVLTVFSKTATGSEGTSYPFTAPSSGGMAARVMRFAGLGALHAASGPATGSSPAYSAAVTTTVTNVLLIGGYGARSGTLPLTDITPSSGFTAVAADVRSTNSGTKCQVQVTTQVAATTATYTYTGTFTPQASTTAEVALVAYLQSSGDAGVVAVRAQATAAAGTPAVSGAFPGTVTAVRATATAAARPPTVSNGTLSASVTAVRATATADIPIPSVDVVVSLTGGGAATATATAGTPVVTGTNLSTGLAVRATATAAARAPTVTGTTAASVSAAVATATVLARPGTITGGSVTSLPAAVTFGAVKGWLAQGVNQSPDADGFADLVADQGTVTFTPTKNVLLFPSASPAPLILTPKVVVATLDSDGYLIGTKTGGAEKLVRLIVGTYTVSYQLTGVAINPHSITITASTTTDLVEVMPT